MATRERVIFNLDRFEWTGPGWLQIWGGWDGIDRRDLADPALIVRARDVSHRLAPPPDGIRGGIRNWHAIFPWEDDPAAIEGAELELGGGLVVELPAPGSSTGRRRFGRTRLAVREVGTHPGPEGGDALPSRGAVASVPAREPDAIALHVAVVAARGEAAEAREELKLAQAAAGRSAEDVDGERARRQIETARLREAMDTLRKLAEEGLQKERAVSQGLSSELDKYEADTKDHRAFAAGLRDQMQALSEELIESREIGEVSRAEADGLRLRVEEVQRETRRADGAEAELESLRADLVESRQVAESWGAEADKVRAQLAEAQTEVERAGSEAERLRAHLARVERDAHQSGGEAERLRAQLEEAQERLEQIGDEAERRQARFEKAQRQAEQSSAEAERLRAHLERIQQQAQEADNLRAELEAAQRAAQQADALRVELEAAQRTIHEAEDEAERLRRSLAAVREALQG
ncbi:MAG: hypothetical protein H0V22_01160 [Solirubrobacterales bacterium]|jgi:archaellum component FlaC|nr:hypothetical protein [Solirubrobacterales bacterium]